MALYHFNFVHTREPLYSSVKLTFLIFRVNMVVTFYIMIALKLISFEMEELCSYLYCYICFKGIKYNIIVP